MVGEPLLQRRLCDGKATVILGIHRYMSPNRDGTSWVAAAMAQGVPVLVAALIAAFIAVFTNVQAQRATNIQLRIAEQGQITDRYNAAITNLGSRSIQVRLGGIYALQRLMQ